MPKHEGRSNEEIVNLEKQRDSCSQEEEIVRREEEGKSIVAKATNGSESNLDVNPEKINLTEYNLAIEYHVHCKCGTKNFRISALSRPLLNWV